MKKIIFFCLLLAMQPAFAQTKDSLLLLIKEESAEIDKLLSFSDKRIAISTPKVKFDPKNEFNFEKNVSAKSDEEVKAYFKNALKASQTLLYPYVYVDVDFADYNLAEFMGLDHFYFNEHNDEMPVFTPTQFHFFDSTSTNAKDAYFTYLQVQKKYANGEGNIDTTKISDVEKFVLENESAFDKNFVINNNKPIQKIDFAIDFYRRNWKVYSLDANKKFAQTNLGNVVLDTIDNHEVVLQIPASLSEKYSIAAFYKDGRKLKQKSYSSFTILTTQKIAYLQSWKKLLEDAKNKVIKKIIATEAELDKYVQDNKPVELSEDAMNQVTYSFAGPVSSIELRVRDTVANKSTFQVSFEPSLSYNNVDDTYFLGYDFKTNKKGILNAKGNWIIEPQFDKHFRNLNRYFYWDQIDDYEATYWFDEKNQQLEKVPYKVDDPEIFNKKYVRIEPAINGKKGLVDVTTGKIVLPMEHDFLHFVDNKYWHGEIHNKEGIYNENLQVLIPFEFGNVDVENGFFFTHKKTTNPNREVYDVYNNRCENLTKGRYTDIKGTFESGLLLMVKEQIKDHMVTNKEFFFIDTNGVEKFHFTRNKYIEVRPFSCGLAKVQDAKTERYGFINPTGTLAIPCMYDDVIGFFTKNAYVKLNGKGMFINPQNKIVKVLEDTYQSAYKDKETGLYNIHLWNGSTYNELGELVK
jgi:hypothetical protein